MKKNAFIFLLIANCSNLFSQKFDDLAKTPPMGWNSWNTFATNIDEKLLKDVADIFITSGLKDAGYTYIVMDDGWMAMERDAQGNLVPDPKKFPNGLKSVADYIHSKGLKFGIYNCAGSKTCGGYPGSRGHEYQDALSYASWDIDYLKYDWCNTEKLNAEGAYMTMRDALYKAGRPVVFSICEWGEHKPWTWAENVGHLWRTTGDITDCWDCEEVHHDATTWSKWGILRTINIRNNDSLRSVAGPSHWNDPDMMEVGKSMTLNEDRSHFTLLCMLSSPLMMGNDIRTMKKETLEILTNKEAIAINQDALGIQAFKYATIDSVDVYAKPLSNNELALCFLNKAKKAQSLDFKWNENTIVDKIFNKEFDFKKTQYEIRDLWLHKKDGTTQTPLKKTIQSHDVYLIKLTGLK